jgi:hypothetical protein
MSKKLLLPTILFLILLPLSVFILAQEKSIEQKAAEKQTTTATDTSVILYYSDQCSHCRNVEKFLEENGATGKLKFAQKNVRLDPAAGVELGEKAAQCKVQGNAIPFLWDGTDGNKCLVGDTEIINYFKAKLNVQ